MARRLTRFTWVIRPVIWAHKCVQTTSWFTALVGTIRLILGATGSVGPARMDLGWASPIIGALGSVSGLERANGWERGAIRGGGRMGGVGGITLITITSASTMLTFITTGGRA